MLVYIDAVVAVVTVVVVETSVDALAALHAVELDNYKGGTQQYVQKLACTASSLINDRDASRKCQMLPWGFLGGLSG